MHRVPRLQRSQKASRRGSLCKSMIFEIPIYLDEDVKTDAVRWIKDDDGESEACGQRVSAVQLTPCLEKRASQVIPASHVQAIAIAARDNLTQSTEPRTCHVHAMCARKYHRKSKSGCTNCRQRKIKVRQPIHRVALFSWA